MIGALLGLLGGWLWTRLSDPPAGTVTPTGVSFGETELDQQVGVTMWFLVIGFALCVVAGFVLAWQGFHHGVATVLAVVVACVVAGLVCYWIGLHVLAPDTKAEFAAAKVGQRIATPVAIGTKIAFLGWPVGGLAGALTAMLWWPRTQAATSVPALTGEGGSH